MKLFQWFKRKKGVSEELDGREKAEGEQGEELAGPIFIKQKIFRAESEEEISQFMDTAVSQLSEAEKALDEAKAEYESITNGLKDIQLITDVPPEIAVELAVAAEKIMELNAEREQFQKSPSKITEEQYLRMDGYGEEIREIMKKMDEDEKYSQLIQNDMQHLEGEKASIRYEMDGIEDRLYLLSKLAGWMVFLLAVTVAFFIITTLGLGENYNMIVYIMLAVIGIALVFIFTFHQQKRRELKLSERKLNKAIGLLNRAKVRYVNITNSIEYQYEKYKVNSAYELNHIWGIYLETKRERELYRNSSRELHDAETAMLSILADFHLNDPRIWVHRAAAILDSREMVEVRHEMNVRRQKLRKAMEYNRNIIDQTNNSIKEFARVNKRYAEEIMKRIKMQRKGQKDT